MSIGLQFENVVTFLVRFSLTAKRLSNTSLDKVIQRRTRLENRYQRLRKQIQDKKVMPLPTCQPNLRISSDHVSLVQARLQSDLEKLTNLLTDFNQNKTSHSHEIKSFLEFSSTVVLNLEKISVVLFETPIEEYVLEAHVDRLSDQSIGYEIRRDVGRRVALIDQHLSSLELRLFEFLISLERKMNIRKDVKRLISDAKNESNCQLKILQENSFLSLKEDERILQSIIMYGALTQRDELDKELCSLKTSDRKQGLKRGYQ